MTRSGADVNDCQTALTLSAFRVADGDISFGPSPSRRTWMRAQPLALADHCLPLRIANQIGWTLLNPERVSAAWDGRSGTDSVRIESGSGTVISNFGGGVVTWTLPYLFRTPADWHLWVKGPANHPVDGATPLEGIVETDHVLSTFTVNWRLTRPGVVSWDRGEPICQLVPIRTSQLRGWETEVVTDVPSEVQCGYDEWRLIRVRNSELHPELRDGTYQANAQIRTTRNPLRSEQPNS